MCAASRAMSENPDKKVIAVAGDVCIDWLAVPIEPEVETENEPNWRLRGGVHMFAERGGAWLTTDALKAALGARARVIGPKRRDHLESVPPDEIVHSILVLERCDASGGPGDKKKIWRVARSEGFAGPLDDKSDTGAQMEVRVERADAILLDDAGNGCRANDTTWPEALRTRAAAAAGEPVIIYKGRRPLMSGSLWKEVHAHHAARTVVVLSADDLRATGALISRSLSWERTAFETWLALAHGMRFQQLRNCAWIVVTFGLEGALVAGTSGGSLDAATLWFVPLLAEGDVLRSSQGAMAGFGSVFAAGLTASLVTAKNFPKLGTVPLVEAVKQGMLAARRLLDLGYGPVESAAPDNAHRLSAPAYPFDQESAARLFSTGEIAGFDLVKVKLPVLKAGLPHAEIEKQRHWRILDQLREEPMLKLAQDVLDQGLEKTFKTMPRGVFEKLSTLDRVEIESFRSVRNLMLEYAQMPKPERPLCLAVFGPPGAGKSYGVTEVAASVAKAVREVEIEKIEFNLSQWDSPAQLVQAFHRVRDFAVRGKVPLVFFDEFDAKLGDAPCGWLKNFLAPMQDGKFSDGQFEYKIGKAIFVFAGGTADTFEEFSERLHPSGARPAKPSPEGKTGRPVEVNLRDAKGRDFLSRLRGHINVFGPGAPAGTNLIRRALVLRFNLKKRFPTLFDARDHLRIDPAVARAFLTVADYHHGVRSIEALIEMSRLVGQTRFEAACLPPESQLGHHVDAGAFLSIVTLELTLGEHLDAIARDIHARYVKGEMDRPLDDGQTPEARAAKPSLQAWEKLDPFYQNSNREQASHILAKLAAIRCEVVPVKGKKAADVLKLEGHEIEIMAQMEHQRWMEERRLRQPLHEDLIPWDDLSDTEKGKDRRTVEAIPDMLAAVGLEVRRLE